MHPTFRESFSSKRLVLQWQTMVKFVLCGKAK